MTLMMVFTLVERLGFSLVLITFLALGLAYHPLAIHDPAELILQIGALCLGAVAIWTAYTVVQTALPDCGLMALATSAFLAVLPGHVAALSSHVLLGVAETAIGLLLIELIQFGRLATARNALLAVAPASAPPGAPLEVRYAGPQEWPAVAFLALGFWAGISLAAAPGAMIVLPLLPMSLYLSGRAAGWREGRLLRKFSLGSLTAITTAVAVSGTVYLSAWWLGASPITPTDLADLRAGQFGFLGAAVYSFSSFWLPPGWETLSLAAAVKWMLALISVMGVCGAGMYAVAVAQRRAGLTDDERTAFGLFYLVSGLALLSAVVVVVRGAAPGPGMLYPLLAPLALLGIIGFESWFPPITRPLFVFALLVGLFLLNLYGLFLQFPHLS